MLKQNIELLLSINDDIAETNDYNILFSNIFNKLYSLLDIELCGLAMFHKDRKKLGCILSTIAYHNGPINWYQQLEVDTFSLVISTEYSEIGKIDSKFFFNMNKFHEEQKDISKVLTEKKIENLFCIPMQTRGEVLGYLILPLGNYLTNKDIDNYLIRISNLIASAIKNTLHIFSLKRKEQEKSMQIKLFSLLLDIKNENYFYETLADGMSKLIPFEYIGMIGKDYERNEWLGKYIIEDVNGKLKVINATRNAILSVESIKSQLPISDDFVHIEITGDLLIKMCNQHSHIRQLKEKYSIVSLLAFRFVKSNLGEFFLIIGRKKHASKLNEMDIKLLQDNDSYFSETEIEFCENLIPQLISIFINFYTFKAIDKLKNKLEQEKHYLLDEINLTTSFQEMIGNSATIQKTLNKVRQVAPLETTVLIVGETGTGKELIARAVHNLSKRNGQAFITVNCAALPVQLIESELFGHEKGSFTGAYERKIGKFEIADKGTIFLDEIGELPLEVQAKLLRVLQEKEFERVGGKGTIYSDIRIVAATNRNLEKEVAQGKFRADLFFRLNVFPIELPPLRERREDIPLLVKHFMEKYSKKIGKEIKSIRKTDLDMLKQHDWQGNIRELEHVIERAVIISQGNNIDFDNFTGLGIKITKVDTDSFKSLAENEKEHIINALKISKGKVTGLNSAAQLLEINGKTLGARMRKLGIKRKVIITD